MLETFLTDDFHWHILRFLAKLPVKQPANRNSHPCSQSSSPQLLKKVKILAANWATSLLKEVAHPEIRWPQGNETTAKIKH